MSMHDNEVSLKTMSTITTKCKFILLVQWDVKKNSPIDPEHDWNKLLHKKTKKHAHDTKFLF